jgi:hypothetical protein
MISSIGGIQPPRFAAIFLKWLIDSVICLQVRHSRTRYGPGQRPANRRQRTKVFSGV